MKQGHAYDYRGLKVLALQNGESGMVGAILDGAISFRYFVMAKDLVALPMKYFHGQVPG